MWTAVFIVSTLICGIGWFIRYISCAAVIYYMEKKGYVLPNDEDIKECTRFVTMKIFKH